MLFLHSCTADCGLWAGPHADQHQRHGVQDHQRQVAGAGGGAGSRTGGGHRPWVVCRGVCVGVLNWRLRWRSYTEQFRAPTRTVTRFSCYASPLLPSCRRSSSTALWARPQTVSDRICLYVSVWVTAHAGAALLIHFSFPLHPPPLVRDLVLFLSTLRAYHLLMFHHSPPVPVLSCSLLLRHHYVGDADVAAAI